MKSLGLLRIVSPSPLNQAQHNEFLREWASKSIAIRDDNFSPPRLTRPSPLHPMWIFPTLQRWWGGDGTRF